MHNLNNTDSNTIINNLDQFLKKGHSINEIVSKLDDALILANYYMLIKKGADQIDLIKIRDRAAPIVLLNNINVFKSTNTQIDEKKILAELSNYDLIDKLESTRLSEYIENGIDPQFLSNIYTSAGGCEMDTIEVLIKSGAKIDTTRLLKNLYDSDDLSNKLYFLEVLPFLGLEDANKDSISKLLKQVEEQKKQEENAIYGGTYPKKLDIVEEGKQTKKIFFRPNQISIIKPNNNKGKTIIANWNGRIMPGQTLEEGIATELKEVYGYTGEFDFTKPTFLDFAKDKKGNLIQRYNILITLYTTSKDKIPKRAI
jgi:hypothetical protein